MRMQKQREAEHPARRDGFSCYHIVRLTAREWPIVAHPSVLSLINNNHYLIVLGNNYDTFHGNRECRCRSRHN